MKSEKLRSLQAPIKEKYREMPESVITTLKAEGRIGDGIIHAEGEFDFRGSLGISEDVPVGFQNIRLHFDLETDASDEQLTRLTQLTERSCVVYQTRQRSPIIDITRAALPLSR